MTAPLDVDPSAQAPAEAAEATPETAGKPIEGRSLGQIAWMRLKRDKVAIAGAIFVIFLFLVAIFAPLLANHDPNQLNSQLLDRVNGGIPKGKLGGVSGNHWLGVEPGNGRDIFSRIVYGARISLLIAIPATMVSVVLGGIAGLTAGFFGGKIDNAISRVMDVLLAFPVLIFSIALIAVADQVNRIVLLIFVIGFFGWPYIGRIVRGQTLSLREREFIDAARSLGASNGHIIFKQLLPNLVAPLLVYATLIIPTNILQEAALSYLGVGVRLPTASWGQMLSAAVPWSAPDPMYMIVPGTALFITVLAFNLFGDGLRDALDSRSSR
ncbi:MAG TPA: ABC transporter permease [Mycobacteriales bacterium]|nr:ABC transporter permease [Mycobacteriales bacterium]